MGLKARSEAFYCQAIRIEHMVISNFNCTKVKRLEHEILPIALQPVTQKRNKRFVDDEIYEPFVVIGPHLLSLLLLTNKAREAATDCLYKAKKQVQTWLVTKPRKSASDGEDAFGISLAVIVPLGTRNGPLERKLCSLWAKNTKILVSCHDKSQNCSSGLRLQI